MGQFVNTNKREKTTKIPRIAAIIVSIFVVAYFLVQQIILPEEREYGSRELNVYAGEWDLVREDGSKEDIELPCELPLEKHRKAEDYQFVLENTLSISEYEDTWMSFMSQKQDIYVYVDGILRLEHNTKDTRPFGNASTFIRTFIHLTPQDNGKTIRVIFVGNNSYTGTIPQIYVGSQMGILYSVVKEEILEIILSVCIILLGLCSVVVGFVLQRLYKKDMPLEHLGWLAVFAGLWVMVESDVKQFMFPNTSMAGEMTFLCLMMIPIFMSLYMDSVQLRKYKRLYSPVCVVSIINIIVCIGLQLLEVAQLQQLLPITFILLIINFIIFIVTVFIDYSKGVTSNYALEIVGIIGCVMAGFMEMLIYIVVHPENLNGSILCIGLIFMLVMSIIKTFQDVRDVEFAKREAIEISKMKDNFLANMSHEIRTPINAVLGMDKMILRETNQQTVREYATDIQNAGNNLLTIINEILDFSKIESGKLDIIPVQYDLSELLVSVYQLVKNRAEDKNLALTFAIDPSVPKILCGDETRIRQIIVNLLTNAVKYTEKGLVTLKLTGERTEEKVIVLSARVEDTGVGIKPEDMEKLFGSFQRLDENRNRNIEGTGLGLAITRQFAKLMQGDVQVESVYGKGSVFTAIIPQEIIEDVPIGNFDKDRHSIAKEEEITKFTCPKGRILVVDDVPMNLKVVKGLLKGTLLQIDTASSGEECLEMLLKKKYDIVFLDHMMPGLDGIETRKEMIKQSSPYNAKVPVIMLTANAMVGAREQYVKQGFIDYLAKPIIEEELRSKIISYMPSGLICYEESSQKQTVEGDGERRQRLSKILNVEEGLMYVGGEMDFYIEILEEYCSDDRGKRLAECFAQADYERYRIEVHALKSTSYSIGALDLATKAKNLEEAAKQDDESYIKSHNDALLSDYEKLVESIREALL